MQASAKSLLAIYKIEIDRLCDVIKQLNNEEISNLHDIEAKDKDCISIQTILAHVVHSGHGYTNYFKKQAGVLPTIVNKSLLQSADEYYDSLIKMYNQCFEVFENHPNIEMETTINKNKIKTTWGQLYDVDQMLEHAIMHIIRHRFQIQKFIV
jgi:uncharacterized damage-inducible protein DinB